MKKASLIVVTAALLSFLVEVGTAHAFLDRSFGQRGVVKVQPPVEPPWTSQVVRRMITGSDGAVYVESVRTGCSEKNQCFAADVLFRYGPDGKLDPHFGGNDGLYEMPGQAERSSLAIDSRNRVVIINGSERQTVVRRLTSAGSLDRTFSQDGVLVLPCGCRPWEASFLADGTGGATLLIPLAKKAVPGQTAYKFKLFRLKEDGDLDESFGRDGRMSFSASAPSLIGSVAPGSELIYLAGSECCRAGGGTFLTRISKTGRVDNHFTRVARHALRTLDQANVVSQTMLASPYGGVEFVGSLEGSRSTLGFVLRLDAVGRNQGLRLFPTPFWAAARRAGGSIVAIGGPRNGQKGLVGITGNADFDPAYSWDPIPNSEVGAESLSVAPQPGRGMLVLDLGIRECRGDCPFEPELFRFVEPRRQKGR